MAAVTVLEAALGRLEAGETEGAALAIEIEAELYPLAVNEFSTTRSVWERLRRRLARLEAGGPVPEILLGPLALALVSMRPPAASAADAAARPARSDTFEANSVVPAPSATRCSSRAALATPPPSTSASRRPPASAARGRTAAVAIRRGAGLARLGRAGQGAQLAREELELARAFDVPEAVGVALRACAACASRSDAIPLLREAVDVLEASEARLEHARALADLGAAVRRAGRRSEAREHLRAALDLADRCGASGLAEDVRVELLATGARPRRRRLSGVESLTPSERRVAQLAAHGATTREIAQSLFVTTRTVEGHLTHAFRKLGVEARGQLAERLADGGSRPRSPEER